MKKARFREAREQANMTMDEVSEKTGVNKSLISEIENPYVSRDVGCSKIAKLATCYNVSCDYLLGLTDIPINYELTKGDFTMENTERKQEEMIIREGGLELCIDHDHITIPVTRFEELIKAEVYLVIARQVYEKSESYDLRSNLFLLFGPLPGKDDDNA